MARRSPGRSIFTNSVAASRMSWSSARVEPEVSSKSAISNGASVEAKLVMRCVLFRLSSGLLSRSSTSRIVVLWRSDFARSLLLIDWSRFLGQRGTCRSQDDERNRTGDESTDEGNSYPGPTHVLLDASVRRLVTGPIPLNHCINSSGLLER